MINIVLVVIIALLVNVNLYAKNLVPDKWKACENLEDEIRIKNITGMDLLWMNCIVKEGRIT